MTFLQRLCGFIYATLSLFNIFLTLSLFALPIVLISGKPLVVSMGSIAASGGYYIAMPAKMLLAERTTVTGSIGVYAALPNAVELSKKIGFT